MLLSTFNLDGLRAAAGEVASEGWQKILRFIPQTCRNSPALSASPAASEMLSSFFFFYIKPQRDNRGEKSPWGGARGAGAPRRITSL